MSVLNLPSRAARAMAAVHAALDEVESLDPDHLSWADQEHLVRGLETAQRRLDALRLRALEGFVRGGGWEDEHHISAAAWVGGELGESRGDGGGGLCRLWGLRGGAGVGGGARCCP